MTRRRRQAGFTLIEMMIVLLIIGLLTVILLPNLIRGKYQSQWSACVQYQRNLAAALENYNAQEKSYPAALSRLTETEPKFINAIPSCPSDGEQYLNRYEAANTKLLGGTFDMYTISCPGVHHAVLPIISQGFPQYNAETGLRQKNSNE